MEVFSWIQQIFDAILSFVPRREIIHPVNKMIKTKWDGSIQEKGAGLHWYFPFLTSIEIIPVQRQSLDDIEPVKFLTAEGIPFFAQAACIYSVVNVVLFSTENYDALDTIRESLSTSIFSCLSGKPFSSLINLEDINNEITEKIDIDLENFGIEIEMVRLSSLSWAVPIQMS